VTVLAILMHVLARYAKVDRACESSWARAWNELIGPDALRVTASYDEVAFLQPPTNEPTSRQSIEAADLLLPNVEHEVKRTWSTAQAEAAIFSLIGSVSRPNVKDHRSSTRTGLCAVLPSADGTLGSEIRSLVSAYDHLNLSTGRLTQAADRFVWLKPYRPKADAPISFADLPRPFLDIGRAQRIVERSVKRFEIWACPNNTIRVDRRRSMARRSAYTERKRGGWGHIPLNFGSALSSLFFNVAAAVAWFFVPGLPRVWSLDLAMEVTMKVRVNLSMALHVVLRGKSVSKPR